jgi:hypothetical protein
MRAFIIIFLLVSIAGGIEENNSSHEMVALQEILDSYHFIYKPQLDVFDCVDMSVANYNFMKSLGYETLITIVEDGSMLNGTRLGHCMALVLLPGGWVGVETKQAVIDTNQSIGKVIGIKPDFIRGIYRTPEEVYAQDRRGSPSITGNVIEKNHPKAL